LIRDVAPAGTVHNCNAESAHAPSRNHFPHLTLGILCSPLRH
jgi:hypothetical protein